MADSSPTSKTALKAFGVAQVFVALFIGVTIYLRWRKDREKNEALKINLDHIGFQAGMSRTAIVSPKRRDSDESARPKEAPPQLESALPTWGPETPAYEVLGLHATASAQEVEEAYRKLLKKYHPDRFASFGAGYQKRAHYVILALQDAREKMLKGKV